MTHDEQISDLKNELWIIMLQIFNTVLITIILIIFIVADFPTSSEVLLPSSSSSIPKK